MNITEIIAQHRILSIAALLGLTLVMAVGLFMRTKKVSPVGWGLFGSYNAESGIALAGHDPISYQQGGPQLGNANFQTEYQGVTWRFANAENLALFTASPEKYVPANGGFCSFAVSKGFTANADPKSWMVQGDKLFVFDSDAMKKKFVAQLDESIQASTQNWATR